MQESAGDRVTVPDLEVEISFLLADSLFMEWEDPAGDNAMCRAVDAILRKGGQNVGDDASRRIAAAGFCANSDSALGYPGVIPHILKMLENGDVSVRSVRNHLPPVLVLDVSANSTDWYVSREDAEKVTARLLPDKLRAKIKAKVEEGLYTLSEAADFLNEASFLVEEEINGVFYDEIIKKLEAAAFGGTLPVYFPGQEVPYLYTSSKVSRVRRHYEQVYWHDLNNWLDAHENQIECRFPDPGALPAPTQTAKVALCGEPKHKILAAEWPLPKEAPRLEKILNDVPKWVEEALVQRGRAGGGADGSHLWNPALLAACLIQTNNQKKWTVPKPALTKFLSLNFPKYLDQWNEDLARDS